MPTNVSSTLASLRGALASTAAQTDVVQDLLDEAEGAAKRNLSTTLRQRRLGFTEQAVAS